ncbi:flagellar protein FliT [Acetobacterium wieringae]|uniref:flagellar protein FliT n=1 Tax=Acetobacterium wieringae TaxID=52694 RepID=UPI0026F318BC|nr:flagellar protein FliT [Acetobacterium wieringae]
MNANLHELCQEKVLILKEYVTKGEEILSSIEDWENLATILEERDQLLLRLKNMEDQFAELKGNQICTIEEKGQIDSLIKLITDMDQNCIQLIKAEQQKTLQDLKKNQQNQKVADYEISLTPSYGTFLDAKK